MKRLLACLLSMTLAAGMMTACAGDKAPADKTTQNSTTEEEKKYETVEIHKPSEVNQTSEPEEGETIAIIRVKDMGEIYMKFFYEDSPLAVENFVTLAANGYYNGVTFHRVIEDFMAQSGDPTATGIGGESIWGEEFKNEYSDRLAHINGSVAMARKNALDTNSSQFFINNNNEITWSDAYLEAYEIPKEWWEVYKVNGGNPHLQGGYTVFGQVYDGQDVLDAVCGAETDENDKPLQDVIIESIEITRYTK